MGDEGHLDGNVLGGMLNEMFGSEMTGVRGCCGHCGTENLVGALLVFHSGPGDVVRCPACMTVLMVSTPRPDGARLHLAELRWLEAPG